MIYLNDIRAFDADAQADAQYRADLAFFEEAYGDAISATSYVCQLKQFGLYTEDANGGVGSKISSAITKIGNKIIELYQALVDMIKDVIAKFKERAWLKSSDSQKLREIYRKDPKHYDQVKVYLKSGDLSFASFKDLNDYMNSVDEVIAKIEQHQADPKTLRGKFQIAARKLDAHKGTIAAVAGIMTAAWTGTQIAVKWKDWHYDSAVKNTEAIQAKATAQKTKAEAIIRRYERFKNENDGKDIMSKDLEMINLLSQMVVLTKKESSNYVTKVLAISKKCDTSFLHLFLHGREHVNVGTYVNETLNTKKSDASDQNGILSSIGHARKLASGK